MSVILLGVAVVVIPYLGIPASGRTFFLVAAGLALIVIGFLLRAQEGARTGKSSPYHPFVESLPDRHASTAVQMAHEHSQHEHKEGITSLN